MLRFSFITRKNNNRIGY